MIAGQSTLKWLSAVLLAAAMGFGIVSPTAPTRAAATLSDADATASDRALARALSGDLDGARKEIAAIGEVAARDFSYARLATLQAGQRDAASAGTLLGLISDTTRRQDAMRDVAIVLARKGDFRNVAALSSKLDPASRDRLLGVMAAYEAEKVGLKEATLRLGQIADLGERENATGLVAAGRARAGDVKAAFSIVAGISDKTAKVHGYMLVARAFLSGDRRIEALSAVRAGLDILPKLASGAERQKTRGDAVNLLLDLGDPTGAAEQASRVADAELRRYMKSVIEDAGNLGVR